MPHVTHETVASFAVEKVNLPSAKAQQYRAQVRNLRDTLERKIKADPGYGLVKMLHSGSVRKGTALRTTSDMDVAVYVKAGAAPTDDDKQLIPWLRDRLQEGFPQVKPEQFEIQYHCVTLSFVGSGLDVDCVPVIYEGEADNVGYLVNSQTGDRVKTSVSQHREFIKARKDAHPGDFAQVVRLAKWWSNEQKDRIDGFRLKSFMIELLLAHLSDQGRTFTDYIAALEALFLYIVESGLQERISFDDFYPADGLPSAGGKPIEMYDPVNAENNVASLYTEDQRILIVDAAGAALDAIAEAHYADTKGREVECWQLVLGKSFKGQ